MIFGRLTKVTDSCDATGEKCLQKQLKKSESQNPLLLQKVIIVKKEAFCPVLGSL